MSIVKILELGKAPVEVAFEEECKTILAVIEQAGLEFNDIKVNGSSVTEDYCVYDGDRVFLGFKKIKGNADYVEIKFIQFGAAGGGITNIAVEPGTSIASAAEQAGVSIDGFDLKVNGSTGSVDASTSVNSDSRVILAKKIKGNTDYVEIKFIQFGAAGGGITNIVVEPGTTIASAAEQAGVSIDGFDLKVNGSTGSVDASTSVNSDSRVILAKKIKGNN